MGPKINWRLISFIFNSCLISMIQKQANNKKENTNLQIKIDLELSLENSNQIVNNVRNPRMYVISLALFVEAINELLKITSV